MPDALEDNDRVYLEKLRLAAAVILELGHDDAIPEGLEAELWVFRDRVERALLLSAGAGTAGPAAGTGPGARAGTDPGGRNRPADSRRPRGCGDRGETGPGSP